MAGKLAWLVKAVTQPEVFLVYIYCHLTPSLLNLPSAPAADTRLL